MIAGMKSHFKLFHSIVGNTSESIYENVIIFLILSLFLVGEGRKSLELKKARGEHSFFLV